MNNDYNKYTADDFLSNPSFLLWCLDPDKKEDLFWCEFAENYPDTYNEFRKAVQIACSVRLNNFELGDNEKTELYESIVSDYQKLRVRHRMSRRHIAIAAAAVFICLCVPLSLWVTRSAALIEIAAEQPTEICLITGDNTLNITSEAATFECNEAGEVIVNGQKLVNEPSAQMNQLVVPNGKRANIVLSDGSIVWINSGTTFSFPSVFTGSERRVSVDGEIYIDVFRDTSRPFIVNNKFFDIRVMGTSFDVKAYGASDRPASVVLVQGSVEVTTHSGERVELKDNDKLSVKGDNYSIVKVDPLEYISWRDGLLVFASEKLSNVIKQIVAFYHVDFECEAEIESLSCTGKLVLFDDLSDTLGVLSDILPIKYRIENSDNGKIKVIISPR